MLTTLLTLVTTGYVTGPSVVVINNFFVRSQTYNWCLQMIHACWLLHSDALCFNTVQLKHIRFSLRIFFSGLLLSYNLMTYDLCDHNKCKLEIIPFLNLFVVDFLFLEVSALFFTSTRFLSVLLVKDFSNSGKVPLLHSCTLVIS